MTDAGAVKLTEKRIDAAKYPKETLGGNAEFVIWDSETHGFGLRVYPSGKKSFIIRYRKDGRRRTVTVGSCGVVTLTKARAKAALLLSGVKLYDSDPAEEKKRDALGKTVADLCKEFEKRHLPTLKPSTQREYKRLIKIHVLPRWKNVDLKSLRRPEIANVHHKMGQESPYQANRFLALVSVLYSKALTWGFLPDNVPNPALGVERLKETSRDRWVRASELPYLAQSIDAEPNLYIRAALWLYLLLGTRKSELLGARWEDVDLEAGELLIPDPKQGTPHHVPLSPAAKAIFKALPRISGNPYVLPGRKPKTALVGIAKAWERVRDRATVAIWRETPEIDEVVDTLTAELKRDPTIEEVRAKVDGPLPTGLRDVRIHDLRRTVGSWLATSGVSLPIIGKTLGHSEPATTQVYARLSEDPVRAALDEHGRKLMEVAGGIRAIRIEDATTPEKKTHG